MFVVFVYYFRQTTMYRGETFVSSALNVYQTVEKGLVKNPLTNTMC